MEDFSSLSDEMAIREVLDGNVEAFEILVMRYQGLVARILSRHIPFQDVEDVAQEVFLIALSKLGKLKKPGAFGSWLVRITIRSCVNYWREKSKGKEQLFSEIGDDHVDILDRTLSRTQNQNRYDLSEEEMEKLEKVLWWSLSKLNPVDRMVVELVYFENLSHKEVAEIMGCTQGGVKIRIFRARRKLRKIIERKLKELDHGQKNGRKSF